LWFWTGSSHLWNWFYDWICCYKMVPCTRTSVELFWLHSSNWCMVCWLYFHGTDGSKAFVSWQRSRASVASTYGGNLFNSLYYMKNIQELLIHICFIWLKLLICQTWNLPILKRIVFRLSFIISCPCLSKVRPLNQDDEILIEIYTFVMLTYFILMVSI